MPANLPNTLTVARIVAVPLLIAAFYLPAPAAHWAAKAWPGSGSFWAGSRSRWS